jgi:hypothetical protein
MSLLLPASSACQVEIFMKNTVESSLGFLARFTDADALQINLAESAMGMALQLDGERSNHAFRFYRQAQVLSTAASVVGTAELRVPVDIKRVGQEFLTLGIRPTEGLTAGAVMAHYGPPQEVMVPTPQAGAGTGVSMTYVYRIDKRKLSFSFGPAPHELLLLITVDR